ncbi:MAG: class I SAM-dependent methyltransferase [Lutibacter sp.]
MFQKFKTSIAYTKNLFVTGAISQSCRSVEIEICRFIPKEDYKIIVEFGMGHGNITREILNNMAPNSKLFAFEVNKSFCDQVRNTIDDDRLTIINDSAENIKKYLQDEVHSVIASIPFSFFSKEKQIGIIQDVYDKLVNDSYYSQALYSKIPFKKFQKIFDSCYIEKIKDNIPSAYVYHCKKAAL